MRPVSLLSLSGMTLRDPGRTARLLCTLSGLLSLALACGEDLPATPRSIGTVTLHLKDKTVVRGELIDVNERGYLLQTEKGNQVVQRKEIQRVEPKEIEDPEGPASPRPTGNAGEAPAEPGPKALAPAAKSGDYQDLLARRNQASLQEEEEELAGPKTKAKEPQKLKPQDAALLNALGGKVQQQPTPVPPAQPGLPVLARTPLDQALASVAQGNFKEGGQTFRTLLARPAEDIAQAEAVAKERFGRPLRELIVSCYAMIACEGCVGEGLLRCHGCNGTGYILQNIPTSGDAAKVGPPPVVEPWRDRARVRNCPTCHGNAYEICMDCFGTRLGFCKPQGYEREAYASHLLKLAGECLSLGEGSFGDTGRENLPPIMPGGDPNLRNVIEQVWLRDSTDRVKSDLMRLWRAEGFYRFALKADPTLVLRYNGRDPLQELNRIGLRRRNLYAELTERTRFQDLRPGQ